MERFLNDARKHLIGCRERLALHRRLGQLNSNDRAILAQAESEFLEALDSTWNAQLVAVASLT